MSIDITEANNTENAEGVTTGKASSDEELSQEETSDNSQIDSSTEVQSTDDNADQDVSSKSQKIDPVDTFGELTQQPTAEAKPKLSRSEKQALYWQKSITPDNEIDPVKFKELYENNPKGADKFLANFNSENDTEVEIDDLVEESTIGIATKLSQTEARLKAIEERIKTEENTQETKAFYSTMEALLNKSNVSVDDFKAKYKEDVSVWTAHYVQQGDSLAIAGTKAFNRIIGDPLKAKAQANDRNRAKLTLSSSAEDTPKTITSKSLAGLSQAEYNKTMDLIETGKISLVE